MPTNPETEIDYEADRFAHVYNPDENTFNVLHNNTTWPRSDGGPIVGGNPDYKYYKRVTTAKPDVDHRYTVSTEWTWHLTDPVPPEGHPVGEYRQSHSAEKLPNEDLKFQVEAQFQLKLRENFPDTQDPARLIEVADALSRKTLLGTLTPAQLQIVEDMQGLGDIVSQLRGRQTELNAAIDAEEDYDIEDGWEIS